MNKVFKSNDKELKSFLAECKSLNKKIVFTNGVFDIIHRGHVEYLNEARGLGDVLIVGINSDKSVKIIKGDKRPIVKEDDRAFVLLNLKAVDGVILFDEDNPLNVITEVKPHILVKGADWDEDKIIGADIVKVNGGEVKRIKFVENNSSTNIIDEIIQKYCG